MAGSPPVAKRIGVDAYHFINRQLVFLALASVVMFVVSLLDPVNVRRLAVIGFVIGVVFLVIVPFVGMEVKGARRWIYMSGVSLQPSEFVKPCFAVVTAWLLAEHYKHPGFPGKWIAFGLLVLVVTLLRMQPDMGMIVMVSLVWIGQLFLSGTSYYIIVFLVVLGAVLFFLGYLFIPHMAQRIDSFLDPSSESNYQVQRSLEAFQHGGFLGVGPGEGTVKNVLPDAHTDFVFAVAGEEFGLVACLLLLGVFAAIVLRGFVRVMHEKDLFIILAVSGVLFQFGLQAFINIGVSLNLLPTKGMTLPFLSYGGSSTLALALGMGMLLALTRRRYGVKRKL